jgi:membrane-associated phospholipid phosphatase
MGLRSGEKTSLRLKLTHQNKMLYFYVVAVLSILAYYVSNQFPIYPAQELPYTDLDHAVPLMPNTIWIYASMYPMMFVCFFMVIHRLDILERGYKAFFLLQIITFLIFLFFPVEYPRHLFPLPTDMAMGTKFVFETIRKADQPINCCPSLHVANSFLCSLFVWRAERKKGMACLAWSVIISFSTMSTKQHYFYDVATGTTFALIAYWVFFKTDLFSDILKAHEE